MNQKRVSCDQMMKRLGYYCVPTVDTYGVCLLKATTAQKSLMVCVPKDIRLDTKNEEILPMRFQKDEEMLEEMNVGFAPDAEFIWVTPCGDMGKIEADEKLAIELTLEQLDTSDFDFNFDFASMLTVKEAEPHEAELFLVRQPKKQEKLTKLEEWRLGVLKHDSLYYQETDTMMYVILPVGYANVVHAAADKAQEFDAVAFYEKNAGTYRTRYQALLYDEPLDAVQKQRDEERMNQKFLPELRAEAEEILKELKAVQTQEREICQQLWTMLDDKPFTELMDASARIGEEIFELSPSELQHLRDVVKVRKSEVEAEKAKRNAERARLDRIQAFRDVITICEYDVTVEDYAGKLAQSRPVKVPFVKEVRVVFAETEVRIELWKNGKQLEAETARYDYNDTVAAFQARLKKLLKAWPYCYREDAQELDYRFNFD